ncbi:MAG: hypothetical protein ACK4ZW_03335 [Blastomonas sp.]
MNTKIVLTLAFTLLAVGTLATITSNAKLDASIDDVEKVSINEESSEHWTYRVETDDMRGLSTKVASIRAEGWVPMSPELLVFRDETAQPFVALRGSLDNVAAPRMECRGGSLKIKFDDGPIQDVGCNMGMVVGVNPKVFTRLKRSKTMWIETWTNIGTAQYKFNTANLDI